MRLKRNKFNWSTERKLTCDMGQLVPVLTKMVMPGAKIRMTIDNVMRVSPLLAPLMHNVKCYFHTFSVPVRLLLNENEWESYITGGVDGNDASILPTIKFPDGIEVGSLGDHLGFPTNTPAFGDSEGRVINNLTLPALPFRAYNLIYNEWYRNQNIQDPLPISLEMGEDTTTSTDLKNRNWVKDYFTRSLPTQQRGPSVYLPSGDVSVVGNGMSLGLTNGTLNAGLNSNTNTQNLGALQSAYGVDVGSTGLANTPIVGAIGVTTDPEKSGLVALGSTSRGTTISDFRWANAVQAFMEKQMRGGARYVETLMSQFGVRSSDARLQRPEYLGGGVSQLVVTPVLQTSSSDTVSPQGNMAGQAFTAQRTRVVNHFFEEHCILMVLMSIMPDTTYQQGISREWLYQTRYDWPWPLFSHTSEQGVYNGELYWQQNEQDFETFGFVPRYDEQRRIPKSVSGEFKTTLNYWHMGRIFDSLPALNSDFITSSPTKRINAVTSEHNCWCDIGFNISALLPLPKTGTPSLKVSL